MPVHSEGLGSHRATAGDRAGKSIAAAREQFWATKIKGVVWGLVTQPKAGAYLFVNNRSRHAARAKFSDLVIGFPGGRTIKPCCGYKHTGFGWATTFAPANVPSHGAAIYSLARTTTQVAAAGGYLHIKELITHATFKGHAMCHIKSHRDFDNATSDARLPAYCK